MKLTKKWIGGLAATAAVLAFAAVGAIAAPQIASAHGGPGGMGGRGGFGIAGPQAADDDYLAEALGITSEELQAAHQQAAEAAIDQAVADGLITQAQADALKERQGAFGLMGKGLHLRFFGSDTIDMKALLADALNISVDELQAAQTEAKDAAVAAAVEAGRITQEQADQMKAMQNLQEYLQEQGLQDNVRSLYSDAIQGAVDAGVITQEQADQLLSNTGRGFGGMRGFGRMPGFGGMRGHGFGPQVTPPNNNTTTTPSSFSSF
ncbi:MAG: hypothetical protein J5I90_04800 [Caldilineales bacterium]|nr:hypothetical protein [Caldilineales bacterium]